MTLYEKVKEKANSMNKSISAIEKEAGIANGTIGKWQDSRPFADTLQKVAFVLNMSIEELLEDEGRKR